MRMANLSCATFRDADLTNVDFAFSNLTDTAPSDARLDGEILVFLIEGNLSSGVT